MTELWKPTRTSRLWKRGDPAGLPMNGLVALYDPYRDAYGLTPEQRALLQTAKDYSGHGNTLTYGATTNASTDDPTNTGTAWSFDGGDYLRTTAVIPVADNTPFCGFVIAKYADDASHGVLVSLNTGSDWGVADKGFWLSKSGSTKKINFYNYKADATYTTTSSLAVSDFSKPHLVFFGWDGANAVLGLDNNALVTTACATSIANPQITQRLTLGTYTWGVSGALVGEINHFALFPTRFLGTAERTRAKLYLKGLMAQRGLTPSW